MNCRVLSAGGPEDRNEVGAAGEVGHEETRKCAERSWVKDTHTPRNTGQSQKRSSDLL